MPKKPDPKPAPANQTAIISGLVAGMAAHCSRIAQDASELQKRCETLLGHRKALTYQQAELISTIRTDAEAYAKEAKTTQRLCDRLNAGMNNKPLFAPPASKIDLLA